MKLVLYASLSLLIMVTTGRGQGSTDLHKDHGRTDSISNRKPDLSKIYSKAIGEYIRLVDKEYKITFDTLFFGKHVYDQPDDFPNISLPEVIEKTNIRLITPAQGEIKQKQNKSITYINMVGWIDDTTAEFIFVTFSNGGVHQFDCFINYVFNPTSNDYQVHDSRFKNYLYKK